MYIFQWNQLDVELNYKREQPNIQSWCLLWLIKLNSHLNLLWIYNNKWAEKMIKGSTSF